MRTQGAQARQWEEGEAGIGKGLRLLDRIDIPQRVFLHELPDLSCTENSYNESLLVLGFISGVPESALMKLT